MRRFISGRSECCKRLRRYFNITSYFLLFCKNQLNGNYGQTNFYELYSKNNIIEAFKKLSELLNVDLDAFKQPNEEVNFIFPEFFFVKFKNKIYGKI
jgi:hypothetical protein